MPPKEKEEMILLDRQVSTMSSVTLSTDLSGSTTNTSSTNATNTGTTSSTTTSTMNWKSLQHFGLSMAIYVLGMYYKELLVPPHEIAYTRDHPYQELSTGDVIVNFELNHDLVYPAAVPSKLLFQTCIYLPLVLILVTHVYFCKSNSWNTTLSSISGLLTGIGMCELLTHMLKYFVLRRRPNFYKLCQWDATTKTCMATPKKVLEAQLSFPSGHSSMAWCGMTFSVLVLLSQFNLLKQVGSSSFNQPWWRPWATWVVCVIPWSWAAYVASSRIADKWHHASDVVAGTILGIACALVSYHALFPPVFSERAGISYFDDHSEATANTSTEGLQKKTLKIQ